MAILEKAGLDAARPGVPNQSDFTHFNAQGRARMVNVGDKAPSHRTATAGARVLVSRETFALIQSGGMKKGDVLTVAQIAGATAALTVYDMCKAVQKDMVITDVRLIEKTGGVHGDFHREEAEA